MYMLTYHARGFGLVGYEVIITNSRYALVGYFITSYPTRAHGIIVKYTPSPESVAKARASFIRVNQKSGNKDYNIYTPSPESVSKASVIYQN